MPQASQNPRDHYALIARALTILDKAKGALSLEGLAARLELSPSHFQRLFSQWVGVSSKHYQQYLTLDPARRLLADRFTVLESSHIAGLSGGGRLDELFLTWEAISPGEYAAAGAGLVIKWGQITSPFGQALVMTTERGICGLAFCEEVGFDVAMSDMRARWPKADYRENATTLTPLVAKLFDNKPAQMYMIGGPFQIKVWEALLAIPPGQVSSYSEIAQHIGHPKAVRAVGTAVGRNPISWLIPCHRAIRKSGGVGGYHWGLPVKRAMLAYEAARRDLVD
ncbi:MAG: bifunctional helix-turn-helix domain-containing protein/methylated-DNA--[protein]-cysteine S-methyltransferase [Paracoccaceae bacterium]